MSISAKQVAELRRTSGAGMMDCKKALVATEGDIAKALEYLQKKSLASAKKRADKIAAEGAVVSYIHSGRIGVLIEVNCETDFVGMSEVFQSMARDVAMHIAAMNPTYLDDSEIPADMVASQRDIFMGQMVDSGKPEHILGRIIEGKLAKWKKEICLLDQKFVKDNDKTVGEYVTSIAAQIKENIKVRRFVRFELGEGIEKKVEDFAAEVAAVVGG
ncbi:MAG: elongation factor Ts [Bradymonadia bacterium]|jgi:elongation factor Ts